MKKTLALFAAASTLALSSAYAGDISGRVTDAAQTVPLRGANVTVVETGQTVTTARDGSFRINGLAAGDYTLEIDYIGGAVETVSVSVGGAGDVADVAVALGSTGDEIVVIGQRGSLNSALNQQRAADGIITVLSADAIGQLPDENVAEAARRALGVSIANDQGEGRFISVRGIDSNLNATSVNGVRLTSPEAGDRRVAMDVIDADVLKNIIINKTLSADMDADSIGGSIELETLTGLDREDMLAKVKLGTIYSELSEEYGEKISGTYANNYMDGKFGVALSGSFQNREFGSENREVDGGWELDDALPYPADELELRNYDVERERMSLAANFDYMANDNTRLFVRSLYNEFSDQEYRSRVEMKVADAGFDFNDANTVSILAGDGAEFEIDRDIKDRLEEQTIYSIATGFEHEAGAFVFDGSIAFTHAEEIEPDRLDTNFDQTFADAGQILAVNVSDPMSPFLVFPDAPTRDAFLDADGYELDKIEYTDGETSDEETALTFNMTKDVMWGENPGFVKAGVKARLRDKSYDLDFREYSYEGDGDTLAQFARTVDYPLDVFGPAADPFRVRDFFNANVGNAAVLELDEDASLEESAVASYEAEEDVLAGYVMAQVDIDNLRLTGGVRIEQTDVSARGNIFDEEDTNGDVAVVSVEVEDDYTDVLPSIAARYNVTDDFIIRASYYASIIRPNFEQFTPAGAINDDDELETGNPALERTEADNFDLLFEYYPTSSSIIQGGIFHKELSNIIAPVFFDEPGTLNGFAYEEAATFQNAEGDITGIEIGYQQALDFLPAPLDGMIVGANYTYSDSEATFDFDGETVTTTLPGQSENIFNAILGYDKGRWDLRAAYSFKDENVDDVDANAGRVVLDQQFLDLSARVEVVDGLKVYADLKNILDTPLEVAERRNGVDYLNQYEEYGYSVQAGIIWKY